MSDKSDGVCGIASIVLLFLNVLGLVMFTVGFLSKRIAFAEIFADFDCQLPVATRLCLSIPAPVAVLVVLVILAALIAKEFLRPSWLPLVLNAIWMAVGGVLTALFTAAMFLPLIQLCNHVGS